MRRSELPRRTPNTLKPSGLSNPTDLLAVNINVSRLGIAQSNSFPECSLPISKHAESALVTDAVPIPLSTRAFSATLLARRAAS